MKKVKIAIADLITVLDVMRENGTTDVIFMEWQGLPAICDSADQDNIISFAIEDGESLLDEDYDDDDGTFH